MLATLETILALDPGPEQSAYALIDADNCQPLKVGKIPNDQLRDDLMWGRLEADHIGIEMVASYGMPVGVEVFETVVWIGRYLELLQGTCPVQRVFRREVKLHLCESARANDATIIQALVDRFAPGARNRGKGTKAAPGWFHGFAADMWQAYALGVFLADTRKPVAA